MKRVCLFSRFSVDYPRSPNFAASCDRLLRHPEQASMQDAWQWIDEQGPTSNDLLEAVAEVDRGVLSFTPYMYHPAVRGVTVARVPTVLHAAAHPEPPLRLPVFDDLFNSVSGIAHYSRLEQRLVLDRFPSTVLTPQVVMGLPVEAPTSRSIRSGRATPSGSETNRSWCSWEGCSAARAHMNWSISSMRHESDAVTGSW